MKKRYAIVALAILAGPCRADDVLKYFTDPEARKVADQLILRAEKAEPVDRFPLITRVAVIGHPSAMMRECWTDADGRGPLQMRYDEIAWCRIIEAEAPPPLTKLRDEAHRQLLAVASGLSPSDELEAKIAERRIRQRMARPWREAEAEAAADATPDPGPVAVGSNGADSSELALNAFLAAVRDHDGAALDRAVNPLDALRLKNNGQFESWRDAQFGCQISVEMGPYPPPAALKAVYRYRHYPLETAQIRKDCHGMRLGTTLIIIQFKGRWFVTTDSI